jgi:hypothetical protein
VRSRITGNTIGMKLVIPGFKSRYLRMIRKALNAKSRQKILVSEKAIRFLRLRNVDMQANTVFFERLQK